MAPLYPQQNGDETRPSGGNFPKFSAKILRPITRYKLFSSHVVIVQYSKRTYQETPYANDANKVVSEL